MYFNLISFVHKKILNIVEVKILKRYNREIRNKIKKKLVNVEKYYQRYVQLTRLMVW